MNAIGNIKIKNDSINCILSNARSLTNKIHELKHILEKYKIQLACITETWLNKNNTVLNEFSFGNKYQPIFAHRKNV